MSTHVLLCNDFEGLNMIMPNERTRSVIQTGGFLLKLSQDSSPPERIRRDAKFLLRHYPDQFQVLLAERIEEGSDPLISPMGQCSALPSRTAITPRSLSQQIPKTPNERLG